MDGRTVDGLTCPDASAPIAASSPILPIDQASASPDGGETSGQDREPCSECAGLGFVTDNHDEDAYRECFACDGTGHVPTWRELYDREASRAARLASDLAAVRAARESQRAAHDAQMARAAEANRQLFEIAVKAQATVREAVLIAEEAQDVVHRAELAEVLHLLSATDPCDQARHDAAKDHDAVWAAMRLVGIQRDEYEGDMELRDCPGCKSTIARLVDPYMRRLAASERRRVAALAAQVKAVQP